MPLPFRGAVVPVLNWLVSLPTAVLDASPLLWVTYASTLLATGQRTGVEQKLQAAEAALQGVEPDDKTRDLIGRIAATRATMAANQQQLETIITQSHRALEFLHPDNLAFRTSSDREARTPHQSGPGPPDPGRHVRSTGDARAIAPADGGKGLAG